MTNIQKILKNDDPQFSKKKLLPFLSSLISIVISLKFHLKKEYLKIHESHDVINMVKHQN
jgi:hypothetical protein